MSENGEFRYTIEHVDGYEFRVKFDWDTADDIVLDEPKPLGEEKGPNASRLIGAAVANCMSASLLFCLQKAKVEVKGLRAVIHGRMKRNERKRLRLGGFRVTIELDADADPSKLTRCLNLFEDYCVVTESVRNGIPVDVEVVDPTGTQLFSSEDATPAGAK